MKSFLDSWNQRYRFLAWWVMASAVVVVLPVASASAGDSDNGKVMDGDYYIVAKHSLKALTAVEGEGGGVVLGQSARHHSGDTAQLWNVATAEDGGYRIRSKRYGTVLAGGEQNENGYTGVVLKAPAAAGIDPWHFRQHLNGFGIELGRSGTTINVTGASTDDDAEIIVYDASEDGNSQWLMYPSHAVRAATVPPVGTSTYDNQNKVYRLSAMPSAEGEATRTRRLRLMDYHPSGVYVKKGEAVSIQVDGLSDSPDGLTVMVGPMNQFWRADSRDDPQIVHVEGQRADFKAQRNGLIYFRYIDSGYNGEPLPAIDVQITEGGRPVPMYVQGHTSAQEWLDRVASLRDAPYVELVGPRVVITATYDVYAKAAKGDPGKVLDLLESLLSAYDELSGMDGSSDLHKPSQLRIHYLQDSVTPQSVWDSGVYMYAADFIVGVPGQYMADLLDPKTLRSAWSIWHETGHKYQQRDWTWDKVVEATVNIYSLDIESRFKMPSRLDEPNSDSGNTSRDLAARYLAKKNRDFNDDAQVTFGDDGEGGAWLRLVMFDQLGQALGPSFYPRLHRYYREHPLADADAGDAGKQVQAFILRSSRIAGVDLGKFFSDWGLHMEPETVDALKRSGLPAADPDMSRLGIP